MIRSQYILDIFDLAFDERAESDLLRNQVPFLTINDINHTGIGVFVHFSSDDQIQQFKIDTSNATDFDVDGNPTSVVNGVEIRNPDLLILADATIHLKNGIIDQLEIWNKCGEDYVLSEPAHYQLDQIWLDKSKRRTIIR